ncbi:response regulator [Rhodopirellula sp. P2]|uniref:response regulator n=1 Tax=Rhodopirellula sp. P2 TaxID=2127060 RepID=UPI0023679E17|nr:response regulator [Rhodopirellula sp. P2]WDQ14980.1 response regulator [Rhodopirellula sp. P2]
MPTTSPHETDHPRRCVIADDVRVIREQLGHWMRELGYSVVHASCGDTALTELRREPTDLVIADIDMPHVSGLHLLQTVRSDANPKVAAIPVIISSSMEDGEIHRMIAVLGGNAYLRKPVSKEQVVGCVRFITQGNSPMPPGDGSTAAHSVSARFRRIASEFREF